jgi:hypothetical protein
VNLSDNMDAVKGLLEKLPTMFTNTREVSSCLGSALGSAFQVIKAIGGKIILFTGLLPAESAATADVRSALTLFLLCSGSHSFLFCRSLDKVDCSSDLTPRLWARIRRRPC